MVIVQTMVVLFAIVIAGYISGKAHLLNQMFSKGLSALIVNLTCPCLIIGSTMGDRMPDRSLIIPLLIVGAVTYVILLTLASHLPKLFGVAPGEQGLYSFMLAFGNVGFIGYPVVASIFGPEAVFYASVLNVPNTFCVFIWGAQFIIGKSQNDTIVKRLYSPAMIGTYLSILVVAFAWHAPKFVSQTFTLLGNITVPGSLLIIGYSISQIPVKHMAGDVHTFIMAAFRLIVLPLVVLYCFRGLAMLGGAFASIFDPAIVDINTLIIAMPVASFGTIFCLKFGVDEKVMAQGTFITTLLSLLTIPLMASLL